MDVMAMLCMTYSYALNNKMLFIHEALFSKHNSPPNWDSALNSVF